MNILDHIKPVTLWSGFNEWDTRTLTTSLEIQYCAEQDYLRLLEEYHKIQLRELTSIPVEQHFIVSPRPKDIEIAKGVWLRDVQYIGNVEVEPTFLLGRLQDIKTKITVRYMQYTRAE
jgi:hypothetical protein